MHYIAQVRFAWTQYGVQMHLSFTMFLYVIFRPPPHKHPWLGSFLGTEESFGLWSLREQDLELLEAFSLARVFCSSWKTIGMVWSLLPLFAGKDLASEEVLRLYFGCIIPGNSLPRKFPTRTTYFIDFGKRQGFYFFYKVVLASLWLEIKRVLFCFHFPQAVPRGATRWQNETMLGLSPRACCRVVCCQVSSKLASHLLQASD